MRKSRLLIFVLVALFAGTAVAYAAVHQPASSKSGTGAVGAMAAASHSELLGNTKMENTADSNGSNDAQAWMYTATTSGTVTDVQVYITSGDTATWLTAGVYTTSASKPSGLVSAGAARVKKDAWNDITIGSAKVAAGTKYVIAIMGTGGAIGFRDTQSGTCNTWTSSSDSLKGLPAKWSTGGTWTGYCPGSMYVNGTTATTTTTSTSTTPTTTSTSTTPTTTSTSTTPTTTSTSTTSTTTTSTTATSTTTTTPPVTTTTPTTTAPPPPSPTPGGTNCAADPSKCGFPDATNTGPQAGHTLTQVPASGSSGGPGWTSDSGDVTVCGMNCAAPGSPSAVAQNFEVPANADVTIPAPGNVTVQDFKVDGQVGRTTPQDFEGVSVDYGAHNVTIAHCNISGDKNNSPDSGPSSVYGGTVNGGDAGVVILPQISGGAYTAGGWGVTVSDCNIHGFHGPFWNKAEDGSGASSPAAAQVHITGNYVHGTECWDYIDNISCPAWGYPDGSSAPTDHCNDYGQSNMPGLSATGYQNVLIDDNTLVNDYQPCESDIVAADSDNATTANLHWVVDHNLLAFEDPNTGPGEECVQPGRGGGSGKTAGLPSYVAVTNNDISNCTPWLYDGPTLTGSGVGQNPTNVECGNYFDDGPEQGFTADTSSFWDSGPSSPPTACAAPAWLSAVPGWDVTATPTP